MTSTQINISTKNPKSTNAGFAKNVFYNQNLLFMGNLQFSANHPVHALFHILQVHLCLVWCLIEAFMYQFRSRCKSNTKTESDEHIIFLFFTNICIREKPN